jgi:hypothetical protein
MIRKIESVRSDIEDTDTRLQNMFMETDEKMRQFSDFLHSIEGASPITKQVREGSVPAAGKKVNDTLVKTVRELSQRGWSPDEISNKLMLERKYGASDNQHFCNAVVHHFTVFTKKQTRQ